MPRHDPEGLVRRIGRRVAELRRQQGLTQASFAERLGVSVQYASRLEHGENVTIHTLARIANILDVEIEGLLSAPVEAQAATARRGRPPTRKRPEE